MTNTIAIIRHIDGDIVHIRPSNMLTDLDAEFFDFNLYSHVTVPVGMQTQGLKARKLEETNTYELYIDEQFVQEANEYTMSLIRQERNRLLKECDWVVLSDVVIDPLVKADWLIYRQALRDLPASVTDVNNVLWPIAPS